MSSFVGIVRVLTTTDPDLLRAHGRQIESHFGLPTRSVCIPDQPHGIHDEETERLAVPKIIHAARGLAAEGASAILISCAADPAVEQLRAELQIPVIGAGSALACVARGLADRVGVLNLTEGAPGPVRRVLGDAFVGEDSPEGVTNTLDLMTARGTEAALEAARRLMRSGARALALACTGYATIGMAAQVTRHLGIVAVDPVDAAGLLCWYALTRMPLLERGGDVER